MTKDELLKNLNEVIVCNENHGIKIFACIKENGEIALQNFVIQESLSKNIDELMVKTIKGRFIDNEFLYESIDDIHDNRKSVYYFDQNEEFCPFSFLNNTNELVNYVDENQNKLIGFAIRFNINMRNIWVYQQVYPMSLISNKKLLYLIKINGRYDEFTDKLLRIDKRVDMVIIGGTVVTDKITLLEQKFGFETFIRNEARSTVEKINKLGFVADISKIIECEQKEKLTFPKKLMKVKNSPVLKMKKESLITKIKVLERYKNIIKIENDEIIIKSQKDVNNLLILLNDDYLISELTEEEYESSSKNLLLKTENMNGIEE